MSAHRGCEGPQALQAATDHSCHGRMDIPGRSWRASAPSAPGNGVDFGAPRLRGTAALQATTDHRCHDPLDIAGQSPGRRPLRRRRGQPLGNPSDFNVTAIRPIAQRLARE
jgi:hypothetical protein